MGRAAALMSPAGVCSGGPLWRSQLWHELPQPGTLTLWTLWTQLQ